MFLHEEHRHFSGAPQYFPYVFPATLSARCSPALAGPSRGRTFWRIDDPSDGLKAAWLAEAAAAGRLALLRSIYNTYRVLYSLTCKSLGRWRANRGVRAAKSTYQTHPSTDKPRGCVDAHRPVGVVLLPWCTSIRGKSIRRLLKTCTLAHQERPDTA